MKRTLIALTVLAGMTAVPTAAVEAEEGCQPYPVGRCGAYDREAVIFCYYVKDGLMLSGTEPALVVGTAEGASSDSVDEGVVYVREGPTDTFVNDPWESDLPFQTLYRESNSIGGLQTKALKCATFEWWAECDSWMGPYNVFTAGPDEQLL